LLLRWIILGSRKPRAIVTLVATTLVLLSFPTFLVYNARVLDRAYYPNEYAAGSFVRFATPQGEAPAIFGSGTSLMPFLYFNPAARFVYEAPTHAVTDLRTEEGLERAMQAQIDRFAERDGSQVRFLILSRRERMYYRYILGAAEENPLWERIRADAARRGGLMYDSGAIAAYAPRVLLSK